MNGKGFKRKEYRGRENMRKALFEKSNFKQALCDLAQVHKAN